MYNFISMKLDGELKVKKNKKNVLSKWLVVSKSNGF